MPRISLLGYFASAMAGWAALETTLAVWFFVVPHGPHFAPEIGPAATFAVFSFTFTIGYFALFIILVLPMTLLLAKVESTTVLRLSPLASGVVFGVVAGVFDLLTTSAGNALPEAVFFFIAGVSCMAVMQNRRKIAAGKSRYNRYSGKWNEGTNN